MTRIFLFLVVFTAALHAKPAPNVLLLCIDDLRPELHCYGVDYIQSPRIDSFASSARLFSNHYVQAPTCGASRYALLTGCYGPGDNEAIFRRAKKLATTKYPPTLPEHFRANGYTTVSIGKISHHPGGWGGEDWDDQTQLEMPNSWDRELMPVGPWKHPSGAMHGLANGEIRGKASTMDVFQSKPGPDTMYPDGLIADEALHQLKDLAGQEKPFFLAIGLIKPHLPFGSPEKYMEPYRTAELPPIPHPEKPAGITTWHNSGEFMGYNRWGKDPRKDPQFATQVRKHYAACVTYADTEVGRILDLLDELKLRDNTIVIVWGDHGWHLGEHDVWGKHTLFEESLRSPFIVRVPGMNAPGKSTASLVETIDLYPTLCDLAGLTVPAGLNGRSIRSILDDPQAAGHAAVSYFGTNQSIRTDAWRMIRHRKGSVTTSVELYDHRAADGETRNVAEEHPEIVAELEKSLDARLKQ